MTQPTTTQLSVLETLRTRLAALDEERVQLAAQVHDLEAQAAAARAAAEVCASEALQIEGLIAFYERRSVNETTSNNIAPVPNARVAAEGELDGAQLEAPGPALPRRRAGAQWTVAWRDEAVAVLKGRMSPMHYRDLYRAIAARGFTFGGKSPEATFLASLSRDQATFVGVGRGNYWLVGEANQSEPQPAGSRRRARRPKPIGAHR
jgi:hypothetical protein